MIIANPQRMFVETLKSAVEGEGRPVVHTATTRSALLEALRSQPDGDVPDRVDFP